MQKLSAIFNRPEYVHTIINRLPLDGLAVATIVLLLGILIRRRTATLIGMALVAVLSFSIWPVYHYGEEGYDRVLSMSDDAGSDFLNQHKELAEKYAFIYFICGGVAAIGFAAGCKWPRSLLWTSLLTVVLSSASLATGIKIAQLGGEVRHREFRFSPPPAHQQTP
ncbi:MAG: hypothetical protein C5B50_22700 [Verrucomicrobia bacterium]|nr:MAG: hypothetical protein C5B50_22700 [Verrucomicrobiota bacterium]